MIGLKIPKLWAVGLVGLTIAFIGALGPANPAAAAMGTAEGGVFYVDVGGNKAKITPENTKITISPTESTARTDILTNDKGGRILIQGIPAGPHTITAEFKLTTNDCTTSVIGAIVAGSPLGVFCASDIAKTYWSLKKTWTVDFKDNERALLDGKAIDQNGISMGTALETNVDGTARVDCDGKGVLMSFVVCPMIESILGVIDWTLINFIQPYLAVNPLTTTDSTGKDSLLYTTWNNIRNFANIVFIAAFFVIVFSQATSVGITNYGIKRLLPRLILIAIGTNTSFFICAFLIDLFNILGAGASSLLVSSIIDGQPTITLGSDFFDRMFVEGGPAGGMASILAQGTLGVGIIFGMFIFLIIGCAILFVAAVAILLRQVVIVFLIIVSPIAFVAGLLPNTQRLFTRWFTEFGSLLVIYPLIMLLFAAGKVAGTVLGGVR